MSPTLKKRLAFLTATWFYSGYAPKAAGTVGSFFTLPLAYILIRWGGGTVCILIAALLLFIIGTRATKIVLKETKTDDPGFVVIDEVVGQLLTFAAVSRHIYLGANIWLVLLSGFALFRFFDIVKIWPACYYDRQVHSAFGVMMDDVVAGIYAAICLTAIVYGVSFI